MFFCLFTLVANECVHALRLYDLYLKAALDCSLRKINKMFKHATRYSYINQAGRHWRQENIKGGHHQWAVYWFVVSIDRRNKKNTSAGFPGR